MFSTFAEWRRYTASVRELSRLSDRELEDIGIARYAIRDVARGVPAMSRGAAAAIARTTPARQTSNPASRSNGRDELAGAAAARG